MNKRLGFFVLVFLLFSGVGVIFAQNTAEETAATLKLYSSAFDMIWMILTASLVMFMQAGFAMVETGLTRAKNAGNILMKNLLDFAVGVLAFWAVGWGIMYGVDRLGLFGVDQFFLKGATSSTYRDWMFQVVFAATGATIASGAMAERTRFSAYLIYSLVVSAIIYPVSGHWIWSSNGWLAQAGFHDFAGSTVVHSVGAWAGLAGVLLLGPRKGKYIRLNGQVSVRAIPGHNIPLAALGVFILWFGWYGFNPGSTLSGTDLGIAHIAVTTTLGAGAGAVTALFVSWIMFGKPDPSMTMNGALAGLVAITAPCAVATPSGAVIIGTVAGLLVVLAVELIDKVLKIDDPVGAISVHGVNGVWGTLAVGLFGSTEGHLGLFYGGGIHQLAVQALGIVAVFAWVFSISMLLFAVIKKAVGLRVSEEEEIQGLDIGEHGMEAYPSFQIFQNQ